MKKTFLIMTMALFIAMLAMTGCPGGGDDDPLVVKPVKSIRLDKTTLGLDMVAVKTSTLTATIINGAAGDSVTWSSSDTADEFVSITSNGLNCTVTANKVTTAPVTITAALSGDPSVKIACLVTVTAAPTTNVKYITLNRADLTLDTDQSKTFTLTATVRNGAASDTVTWSSSDTASEFVSISVSGLNCTVTAKKVTDEPVIITATLSSDSSIKSICQVTVSAEAVVIKEITLNNTSLAFNLDSETKTATLTATIVKGEASDTVIWSSSDTTSEFVSISANGLNCTVTAKKATNAAVLITATLSSDPSVKAVCQVTVSGGVVVPLELKLYTNAADPNAIQAGAQAVTTALPDPVNNVYTINSGYAAGNWGGTNRFADTTFVYVDKLITGNFKFRARVQVGAFPAGTSNSKGMMVGAFKPDSERKLPPNSSVAALFLRGNSAVRGALPRAGDPSSVGGMDFAVNRLNEFIYEFQRTDAGFVSKIFVSKTGTDELATSSSSGFATGGNNYEIQADTGVYAGVALMCVEGVRISQLELWIDDLTGDPVFYSGPSTAAVVLVDSVKLGVEGGTVTTGGTNPGSATNPATYIVKASDVTTSGIQLVSSVVPTYADDVSVKYFKEEGGSANLNINADTGKVTVTGTGTATFFAMSYSNEGAMYYLTITVTADYLPIQPFTITGGLASITVGQSTTLSTDISPEIIAASDPQIVWTASSADVKFMVAGEEEDTATGHSVSVKGVNANAAVTITATATTKDGTNTPDVQTATKIIAVTAQSGAPLLNWTAKAGETLAFTAPIYMNPDGTVAAAKGPTTFTWIARDAGSNYTFDAAGGFTMVGRRFNIGTVCTDSNSNGATTKATTATENVSDGELNLTLKTKVTVTYSAAAYSGATTPAPKPKLLLYVNNNTSSGGNSLLGSASRPTAKSYKPDPAGGADIAVNEELETGGGTIFWIIDPADFATNTGKDSLEHAFIQIRNESSNSITITGIKIEGVTN